MYAHEEYIEKKKTVKLRDCPQILYGFYTILYNFNRFYYWKKSFEIVFERKLKQLDTNLKRFAAYFDFYDTILIRLILAIKTIQKRFVHFHEIILSLKTIKQLKTNRFNHYFNSCLSLTPVANKLYEKRHAIFANISVIWWRFRQIKQ